MQLKQQQDGNNDKHSDIHSKFVKLNITDNDEKDTSDTSDNEDDDVMMNPFINPQLTEQDKFDLLMPEWAKYMLRLDEHQSLKDFLNVVSGFDIVSSKSDYFVDDNNAFSMLTDVMDMVGDFDEQKDPMNMMIIGDQQQQETSNPLMDAWDSMNSFDITEVAKNKWNSVTAYFQRDDDDDDDDEYDEYSYNNDNLINDNDTINKHALSERIKNNDKSSGNFLTSWWSEK